MESESPVGLDELKLEEAVAEGSLDFYEWTSLISQIEKTYPDDINRICLVYDSFLSKFPLCYGYWRKYADHKTRLCTVDKVAGIFEQAVQSATYSVGVWVDYCSFSMSVFEDPFDIRSTNIMHSEILVNLKAKRFKKLVAFWEVEMESKSISAVEKLEAELVLDSKARRGFKNDEISRIIKDLLDLSAGSSRIKALKKYQLIGEWFYKEACQLNELISCFEANIQRSYFHVEPLEASQLENWHHYLDFVEMQGDFDWAVKLYERCLIPCANYPEYWMRYVQFVESKGGREIATYAMDRSTLGFLKDKCSGPAPGTTQEAEFQATKTRWSYMTTKLKNSMASSVLTYIRILSLIYNSLRCFNLIAFHMTGDVYGPPHMFIAESADVIHLFNSRFKEQIGDAAGARAAFILCEAESESNFVENVKMKANMEKRMGNLEAASNVYKEALETATMKEMSHTLPILYVHFARHTFMSTGCAVASRDVLIDGIKHVPHCKLLLEELINFTMMHEGPQHINVVESVVANAIFSSPGESQGLNAKDAEDISNLYLEFVDHSGNIHDLRRAWNRHTRFFPESLRKAFYKHPSTAMKTMKLANEGREETFVAKSCQPSIDSCSNLLIQLPLEDNKMSPLENDADAESDQAPTNISERKLLSVENDDNQFELVSTDQLQSGEAGNNLQEVVEQSSREVSEFATKDISEPNVPSEDLVLGERVAKVPNQLRRNSPESYVSSPDLVGVKQASPEVSKQLREDTYEPYVSSVGLFNHVDYETECVQASQEYFKEFEVQQQQDQEPEQDLKPLLLENLSLNTRNDEFLESVPSTSHKCETPEETSMSNRSFLESSCDASPDASFYSPLSTQASARTNIEAINTSSPTSHQNLIRRQPLGQPQITPNIGGNWHQKNTTDRVRRRSKFGFRGNSQRKQRQESPQHYPQAEMDAQTSMSQGYSNQPLPPLNVQRLTRWGVAPMQNKSKMCKNRCRPAGSEALPEGIVAKTSNLEMRPLWGPIPKNDNAKPSVNLLAIAVGIKQKYLVNQIVKKFPSSSFTVMLFHYDGIVDEWRDLPWSDHAIHVSAKNQTKWWFAKRFLHPDIVAEYDYIFLWDEDLGVENFDPKRYLSIVQEEGLQISQPALDPTKSEVHHPITIRSRRSSVHRRYYKLKGSGRCDDQSTDPPCVGWVEMMAPVFSRAAWQCAWYMIQNDLIHAWGLDRELGYCAQGDRTKNVGVVDSEYIVHLGLPTLGASDCKAS
ncbi:Pre-mRNA-processing factor 39 [Morella rubra]|uniref:Pre-mRNA-processing factor 39 n=1 Tax=Morella rubra TaxID=262757 RepID=A0A6A1V9V6_9ROSI|nr:Pre-mRNA-processing factor 39 [Morella rubra]